MNHSALDRLSESLQGHSHEGNAELLAGLAVYRCVRPTEIDAVIYEPFAYVVVQGEKETTLGDRQVTLKPGHCVVVGHDLPVLARISRASKSKPYLALALRLDLRLIRQLCAELADTGAPEDARSFEVARVDASTLDVLQRYLNLASDAQSAAVLLPLVRKELHYRLLTSESGAMLRALSHRDSRASNVAKAIKILRKEFKRSLQVSELARSAGMSDSSFHKHFKAMTATTPLQYQKDLRLAEARSLLQSGTESVSNVAFEVGYESASQFSREYSRKFGVPPRVDLQAS